MHTKSKPSKFRPKITTISYSPQLKSGLRVSKSLKQFMVSSILPKSKGTHYPE